MTRDNSSTCSKAVTRRNSSQRVGAIVRRFAGLQPPQILSSYCVPCGSHYGDKVHTLYKHCRSTYKPKILCEIEARLSILGEVTIIYSKSHKSTCINRANYILLLYQHRRYVSLWKKAWPSKEKRCGYVLKGQ